MCRKTNSKRNVIEVEAFKIEIILVVPPSKLCFVRVLSLVCLFVLFGMCEWKTVEYLILTRKENQHTWKKNNFSPSFFQLLLSIFFKVVPLESDLQ